MAACPVSMQDAMMSIFSDRVALLALFCLLV